MSRTKITSSNSSINDASTAQRRTDKLNLAPDSRWHPDVAEAEKRHSPIASEFFSPEMFDLELPPQLPKTTDDEIFQGQAFDLDPLSRTVIVLPPRRRDHFGSRRQAPAMICQEAYCDLEIPNLDRISELTPAVNTEVPTARTELNCLFSGIESAPAPDGSWGRWFLGLFVAAWAFWRRERDISRSIVALSELDDRSLRDIGIEHRLQIPDIVRKGRQGT